MMPPERTIAAIAEALGWAFVRQDYDLAAKLFPNPHHGILGVSPVNQENNPGWENRRPLWLVPNYPRDVQAIQDAVLDMCHKHGWAFQQPYVIALRHIVTRRRGSGGNEEQRIFWMAEANAAQRSEAFLDAVAILLLAHP